LPQKPGRKLQFNSELMQKHLAILVFALILLNLTVPCRGQKFVKNSLNTSVYVLKTVPAKAMEEYQVTGLDKVNFPPSPQQNQIIPIDLISSSQNYTVNQYAYFNTTRDLGIICQKEWQLEKKTGIPFRFRLGSLEHVDKIEGKH